MPEAGTAPTLMTAPPRHTSTLGDAFFEISSSLTSSFAAGNSASRVERTATYEDPDAWRKRLPGTFSRHNADKLVLYEDGNHSWNLASVKVELRSLPFEHGGQRNAFHLFMEEEHYVAKVMEWFACILCEHNHHHYMCAHAWVLGRYVTTVSDTYSYKLTPPVTGDSLPGRPQRAFKDP